MHESIHKAFLFVVQVLNLNAVRHQHHSGPDQREALNPVSLSPSPSHEQQHHPGWKKAGCLSESTRVCFVNSIVLMQQIVINLTAAGACGLFM